MLAINRPGVIASNATQSPAFEVDIGLRLLRHFTPRNDNGFFYDI